MESRCQDDDEDVTKGVAQTKFRLDDAKMRSHPHEPQTEQHYALVSHWSLSEGESQYLRAHWNVEERARRRDRCRCSVHCPTLKEQHVTRNAARKNEEGKEIMGPVMVSAAELSL